MQVYLIRHTTPDIKKGVCYGQTDIPTLSNVFEQELSQIQNKLNANIGVVYSSPLIRCKQLAQSISPNIIIDNRLMEMNFGDWEMQNWDEINDDLLALWMNDFVKLKTKNGESYLDLFERSESFINHLLELNESKVFIVTHAGNIRSIISWALGLPLENSFRIHLNYGAVICLNLDKDKKLNSLISIQ